ncbi:MAG: CapA family protein [Candidatus Krumholzibacteriia bacterium]
MTSPIRFIAGGDIMLGEHPAMVGRGTATRLRRDAAFDPFEFVKPILSRADLALANLECALSDWPALCRPSRRECRGPTAAVGRLAASGFHAFTVANNHIQQHGEAAVRETVDALESAGLCVVGLAGDRPGSCRPVTRMVRGQAVRLLGYSLRPRQGFTGAPLYAEGTREAILADIQDGKAAGARVVVTIHWGDEFVHMPDAGQVALGRAMIEAGCDLVVGHHPHVLQGWQTYHGRTVLYSLGNLVFDMPWLPQLRRSALYECSLTDAGCDDERWHPLLLDDHHRPRPAAGEDEAWITGFLERARADLEAGQGALAAPTPTAYASALAQAAAEERWTRNRYFLKNLHRYRPDVSGELIGKFVLRRLGLLHD